MAFRANEAINKGREELFAYYLGRYIDVDKRAESKEKLYQILDRYGPVVDSYPSWHPLVSIGNKEKKPWTDPMQNSLYVGLDHSINLRNAILTCPYSDGSEVIEAVENFPFNEDVVISAEILDVQLYNSQATPCLITCDWNKPLNTDKSIPRRLAVPLMMEFEMDNWRSAQVAETWKTMQTYILGSPYGARSSLFIDQECGQYLKKIYTDMINSGMYGPIYVG